MMKYIGFLESTFVFNYCVHTYSFFGRFPWSYLYKQRRLGSTVLFLGSTTGNVLFFWHVAFYKKLYYLAFYCSGYAYRFNGER